MNVSNVGTPLTRAQTFASEIVYQPEQTSEECGKAGSCSPTGKNFF